MDELVAKLRGMADGLTYMADEINTLIIGLSAQKPEPVPVELKECEHKNTQEIAGAGPTAVRTVCVDCGKEL